MAGADAVPGGGCVMWSRTWSEVIQDASHDSGIKAWVICPGFVETGMGHVIPGANPASFLTVDEVVDVVRYLLHLGDNVELGPGILLRTMRNPIAPLEDYRSWASSSL
jgi:hypothetical protein